MPQQKLKVDVLIIFMESKQNNLKYLRLRLQDNTELQQIVDHLKTQNKIPFRNCIFTTKPAEKGQFTMQKTIKQVSNQCKMKDGAFILLCYESQLQNVPQDSNSQLQTIKSSQKSQKASQRNQNNVSRTQITNTSRDDKKKEQEKERCLIF